MMYKKILLGLSLAITLSVHAQSEAKGWHLKDLNKDGFYGISINKAYEELKGKKSKEVIVAVIDSGIDTAHEDLKAVMWTNKKEIPGNGIDDDGNGYVDDIHGWNFLGNKNGENLKKEIDERTRVYYRFKSKYGNKIIKEDSLSKEELPQYLMWKRAAAEMKSNPEDEEELRLIELMLRGIRRNSDILKEELKKDEFSLEELEDMQLESKRGQQAKLGYVTALRLLTFEREDKNTYIISQLSEYIDGKKKSIEFKTTSPPDFRAQIIKDNYFDINDKYYGNNDIMGPDPLHGTHVSGIIGALRGNGIGADGVADNVKIMMIRAVPDGDEYDKDVALAIKYAVDNGAKVINMSFGKSFSPEKKWVDEAIRYAESKDVLIVHAAGNESENVEIADNYPNADLRTFNKKADNFINVGASGDPHVTGGRIAAEFSNYGKMNVDVFAPGVKIYSTFPGGNQYGYLQGTSMASPVVAGVAALIRSYYPELSAKQIKFAIESSAFTISDPKLQVLKPGTNEPIKFSELCRTGGLINAAGAVQTAASLKPEEVKKDKPAPIKNLKINQ